jgi:DNA helicase-2/ATP-dependent DNA helicase PcrA
LDGVRDRRQPDFPSAATEDPFVLIGGRGFYDRPEVRDMIAMLRAVLDPQDVVALARPAASETRELLEGLAPIATRIDVRDLFFELVEQSGYPATADVTRFGDAIAAFCETSPDHSLAALMQHLELVLLSGEDEEQSAVDAGDAIHVMTIHQSKGLEFESVFVPSLVEGRLPQFGRSPRFELPPTVLEPLVRGREDIIAEERRLLYVAMTRARHRLVLSRAAHYEGGRRWRESRFLAEVRAAGPRAVSDKKVASPGPSAPEIFVPSNGHQDVVQLSYSAIAAYRDCPRQYWYRHVERLPTSQSAEAVHGVILHEVLRQAAESRRAGAAVTGARLRSLFDGVWRTIAFPDPRRRHTFKRIGAAELEAYRRRGGLDAVPAYIEHPFQVAVDGWSLRGVIDRIDRDGEAWRIIDYKSGRPVARKRRDLQVALYALGASSALNLEPIELEVVYLASGESVRISDVGQLVYEAAFEGSEVAAGIRAGRFEARPERRRCRLCPYRLACVDAL